MRSSAVTTAAPSGFRGYGKRLRRKTTLIGSTSASHRINGERENTHTSKNQKLKHKEMVINVTSSLRVVQIVVSRLL